MDKGHFAQQVPTQTISSPVMSTATVTDNPTREHLQLWWQRMQSDDLCVAYADSFPQTLTDFCLDVTHGERLLLLCLLDGQVGGAFWLHDLFYGEDGMVIGGWLGAYFFPAYRGRSIIRWWKVAHPYWEAQGIKHFFSAIHVENRCSQVMLTGGLHFHLAQRFPGFAQYHGQWADLFIYTLHAEDKQLARELAAVRAARQRAGRS